MRDAPLTAPPFVIEPGTSGLVRIGSIRAAPVRVRPAGPDLDREIEATTAALAARHAGRAPSEIPGLQPARDLYKAFGIDPTRTRPSSEALLRRVLQHKPFPSVLNAVDVANLCSVSFLLPLGLYDVAKVRGAVTLRRGLPGESYPGIRKDDVHLDGRPTLVDDEGPFGNPTSDSLRTSVTEATRSLWMTIFAPAAYPAAELEAHVARAAELMARHLAPDDARVVTLSVLVPT